MSTPAEQRLALLDAIAGALERRDELLAAVEAATSDSHAAESVATLLGTSEAAAQAVLDLQLRRFTPASRDRINAERRELRGEL